MTNLVLKSEILNNVLENKSINRQEIIDIYQKSVENSNELFLTAQRLRIKNKNNTVTFSKKAFFNIINLCKDTCSYCTYKAEPGEEKISLMSKQQIKELLQLAKKYRKLQNFGPINSALKLTFLILIIYFQMKKNLQSVI